VIEKLKIYLKSNSLTELNIQYQNKIQILSSEECTDIDLTQNETLNFYTVKASKISVIKIAVLFFQRFLLFIFNAIIMAYGDDWMNDLDPCILYAVYTVKDQELKVKYIPSRVCKSPISIRKPQLIINNVVIETNTEIDFRRIDNFFIKRYIDIISGWIYCFTIITLPIILSDRFKEIIAVYVILIVCIGSMFVWVMFKTYKTKKVLLNICESMT